MGCSGLKPTFATVNSQYTVSVQSIVIGKVEMKRTPEVPLLASAKSWLSVYDSLSCQTPQTFQADILCGIRMGEWYEHPMVLS